MNLNDVCAGEIFRRKGKYEMPLILSVGIISLGWWTLIFVSRRFATSSPKGGTTVSSLTFFSRDREGKWCIQFVHGCMKSDNTLLIHF